MAKQRPQNFNNDSVPPAGVQSAETEQTVESTTEQVSEQVNESPVVEETIVTETTVKETVVEPDTFATQVAAIKKTGNITQKKIVEAFEQYISEMGPGVVVKDNVGARIQYRFWTIIRNIINNTDASEFRNIWSLVLEYFKNNSDEKGNGALGKLYIYRFTHEWTQSKVSLDEFQAILNLIDTTIYEPDTKITKIFNFDVLNNEITEAGRAKLLKFYNV